MFLECEVCKNTLFENISTFQMDESDFVVRGPTKNLKIEVLCIPIVKCISCGYLMIPSTSLVGKNNLDLEVKAYSKLIDAVNMYNSKLKSIESSIIDNNYNLLLEDRVNILSEKLFALENTLNNNKSEIKGKEIVKAAKSSRKKT